MRRKPILLLALAATGLVLGAEPSSGRLAYRFEEVKSKVLRAPAGDGEREARVVAGDAAEEGDGVRTGFFGRALLSVPSRAARFELSSSTRVRLAGPEPGVLLVLESGRLKAVFDAFTGSSEERRVAAPGALLAVRGTRYGLEVLGRDETALAVFEGTVEVFPEGGKPSFRVDRDEYCVFGRTAAPRKGRMSEAGMSEKSWGSRGAGMSAAGGGSPGAGAPAAPGAQGNRPASGGRGGH